MKTILAALLFAASLFGQGGQLVTVGDAEGPAYSYHFGYSGTSLLYVCKALSFVSTGTRTATFVSISAVSKAAAAVVTSTGHGFQVPGTAGGGSRPKVAISGATGTGWPAINSTWTATVIDANTFSIPIDSSGFGTLAGTVVFNTTAPRLTVAEWSVKKLIYDATPLLIDTYWLNGTSATASKCSDATSTSLNQQ